MKRAILAVAFALSACAQSGVRLDPAATGEQAFSIVAEPVALNPAQPEQQSIGDFRYAGGLVLSSPDQTRFHWLSDIAVSRNGAVTAVGDEGDVIRARIVLDRAGRLVGLTDGRIRPMVDLDGKVMQGKLQADAEGLAVLANGDLLVSFEQNHRIWLYPAKGGPARVAPMPQATLPGNGGLEALSADPDAGPDAYVTGAEESGQTWTCRVSTTCTPGMIVAKPDDFGLVAVTRLPKGRTAWLLRAWDRARGNRVSLVIYEGQAEIARMEMARPMTIDNLEGLAAVPGRDGSVRFYIVSDDNHENGQRTLMLAFDWKPPS